MVLLWKLLVTMELRWKCWCFAGYGYGAEMLVAAVGKKLQKVAMLWLKLHCDSSGGSGSS
ncbi:hypothetical protein C5167_002868 [Papaver somniferum]|uniref:Uncharacterized protein n=1 Tax=Papaver somniferum TaxID=3469 RepID=A0A4Y7KZE8_PAPSO|nr:hypothetical protein C5167_002868 [Papaver somniferum]